MNPETKFYLFMLLLKSQLPISNCTAKHYVYARDKDLCNRLRAGTLRAGTLRAGTVTLPSVHISAY